ncbi:hypothetical protein GC175_22845 [bacterium]|nr:hypothetical protein [bacterium]
MQHSIFASHRRACLWRLKLGLCLLLAGLIGLLPHPLAAQDGPPEDECYEQGALRIVMSWDAPFSIGALRIDDPFGNYSTSWKGWPEGINAPEGIEGGIFLGIPGSAMSYTGDFGSPIEFTLPDPGEGTYRIRAAVPEWAGLTQVTLDLYVDDLLVSTKSRAIDFVEDFYTWHWDVGEFVICGDKPLITNVKPKYKIDNTRFLEGIPVVNPIVVSVDWVGLTPERVEFNLNGQTIATKQASGKTVEHTLDMGSDLDDDLNRLEIIAYGKAKGGNESLPSDPKHFQFYSIPLPTWLTVLTTQGLMGIPALAGGTSGGVTYDMGFQIPVKPFTVDALRIGPPDGKAKFEWGVNGGLTIPIDCVSSLSASINAKGGKIQFLNPNITLTGSGKLTWPRDGACGFLSPTGTVAVKGAYKGNLYNKPVLVMVTYFNVAVGQTVDTIIVVLHLEEFVGKIGEFYIDGTLGLEANAKLDFAIPAIQDLGLRGDVGITGGFRSDLKILEVNVYAGANGAIAFLRPGTLDLVPLDNWQFDKITLKGEVGAKLRTFWFVREAKGNITWTYPASTQQAALLADEIQSGTWQWIPHPAQPTRLRLQLAPEAARSFAAEAAASAATAVQTTVTSTLIANVYPYPDTSLAVNPADDDAIVLWVDVDDTKPLGQAQELYFSRWDGVTWQTPAAVTDDNLLDGAPQVAWAADGQAVALWHRAHSILPLDATPSTTVTQQIEIATAVYSPTSASWGPVSLLTTNAVLDATPQLARGAGGELAAAWRRNAAGLLVGDADNPDQIVTAFYQNGWQSPAMAVDAIPGLLEFAVGIGKSGARNATTTIAYTQDVLPTNGITPTAQLFVTTWNGSAWSMPEQLTDDNETQRNPQIVYTLNQIPFFPAENEPLLLWLAGDQLQIRNLITDDTQTLPLPADILGVDEFRALLDAEGNIAVVFVNKTLPRELYLVYYDKANRLWGSPRRLTNEGQNLKAIAPSFDSSGALRVAYAQTAIDFQTFDLVDEEPFTYTLPVETQTDLVTLSHTFVHNLAITDADLAFARSEAVDGQVVISATVHNDSDKAVRNVRLDFYRGDPEINGQWFNSAFVQNPMPGNSHATVAVSYVPRFTPEDIYVTVSAGGTVESNDQDNKARLLGIGADLEIVQTEVEYTQNRSAIVHSVIRNNGYSDVYDGTLVYAIEGLPQPLAQESISVLADAAVTVATTLDLSGLQPGVYTVNATAGLTNTSEFTSADNLRTASLYVLPDLAVTLETVEGGTLNQATVAVSVTVRNIGAAPSGDVPVHLYSAGDFANGSQIHAEQVAGLPPSGVYTRNIQLVGPLCQIYVVVDPANQVDELSTANNIAALLTPAEACTPQSGPTNVIHLPMISAD